MAGINKLATRCKVTEANGTATNIIDVHSKATLPEDATLTMIMDELKTNNDLLTTAVNKDEGIAKTEEYDAKRDRAYQNLYHFIFGMTKLGSADSMTLWAIMKRYGSGIIKESYTDETSKLNSLIEELNAHSTEIDSVSGTVYLLTELKTAQKEFQDYYSEYVKILNEAGKIQSASEVKPAVMKTINDKLVVYLRTQAQFNADNYGDFANQVAILINKTNENVKERSAKK